jgi:hypothetical protein
MRRTLSLKREVLTELTAVDLAVVNGAAPPPLTTIVVTANTAYSCLDYISCNELACVVREVTDTTKAIVISVPC